MRAVVTQYLRVDPEKWMLFVWGGDVPGSAFGWGNSVWKRTATGPDPYKPLHNWFRILSDLGFGVLYVPPARSTLSLPLDDSSASSLQRPDSALFNKDLRRLLEDKDGAKWTLDPHFEERGKWEPNPIRSRKFPAMFSELFDWFKEFGEEDRRNGAISPESTYLALDPNNRVRLSFTSEDSKRSMDVWGLNEEDLRKSDLNWARIQYVFMATLLRESRHYSVMRTEPMFPSYDPYNTGGDDQDEQRAAIADFWLERLERMGVVRTKPGHFYWMRWTARHLIQSCLTGLEFKSSAASVSRNLKGVRAVSFGRIADWYLAAFRATGNITPLIESLYHRSRSIYFSDEAAVPEARCADLKARHNAKMRPRKYARVVRQDMLRLFISSIAMGRDCIRLQAQPENAGKMFGKSGWVLFCDASGISEWPSRTKHENRHLIDDLEQLFIIVGEEIDESASSTAARRIKPAEIVSSFSGERRTNSVSKPPDFLNILSNLRADRTSSTLTQKQERIARLQILVERAVNSQIIGRRGSECLYLPNRLKPSSVWRLFEEGNVFSATQLLLGRNERMANQQGVESKRNCDRHYRAILMAGDASMRVGRFLDRIFVAHGWAETLRMQAACGLALGRLNRFREAHRRLKESASYGSFVPAESFGIACAIVELRRAEIYRLMATAMPITSGIQGLRNASPYVDEPNYTRLAYIDDCWSALERAHEHLKGRNRAVHWWGRLYQLRMRVAVELEQMNRYFRENHDGAKELGKVVGMAERSGRYVAGDY